MPDSDLPLNFHPAAVRVSAFLQSRSRIALVHDVWIGDVPRVRALLSVDKKLPPVAAVIGIGALPATILALLFAGERKR
ncbi:hypothetical protein I6F35_38555 [Bradyrhizobium sp. BRP22]|uniref:hypothetical protein n=1 Tax=Bradyrhizobium sp. BRP22 TaxID=2793821 RepID=UPI001CD30B66|nr:hypothetical protein [Bradyrhizobium sp. BRP22]MCA1458953.1 hypothetical protein [Bradyrhizobium sp. BRP22]